MARFLSDSSCLVAAVSTWHEHHQRAAQAIESRLNGGDILVLPAPALVEAYAVLTRLPSPYRLSPSDALYALQTNYLTGDTALVALEPADYGLVLQQAAVTGLAGGAIYDAMIVACAVKSGAQTILTFNERHFRLAALIGVDIVVPA